MLMGAPPTLCLRRREKDEAEATEAARRRQSLEDELHRLRARDEKNGAVVHEQQKLLNTMMALVGQNQKEVAGLRQEVENLKQPGMGLAAPPHGSSTIAANNPGRAPPCHASPMKPTEKVFVGTLVIRWYRWLGQSEPSGDEKQWHKKLYGPKTSASFSWCPLMGEWRVAYTRQEKNPWATRKGFQCLTRPDDPTWLPPHWTHDEKGLGENPVRIYPPFRFEMKLPGECNMAWDDLLTGAPGWFDKECQTHFFGHG